jgi:hypothetical protein
MLFRIYLEHDCSPGHLCSSTASAEIHSALLSGISSADDALRSEGPVSRPNLWARQWKLWEVPWPSYDDFPGQDELFDGKHAPPTPWDFSKHLLEEVRLKFEDVAQKRPFLLALYRVFAGELADTVGAAAPAAHPTWLHAALSFASHLAQEVEYYTLEERRILQAMLQKFLAALHRATAAVLEHKFRGVMFWEYSSDASGTLLDTIDSSLRRRASTATTAKQIRIPAEYRPTGNGVRETPQPSSKQILSEPDMSSREIAGYKSIRLSMLASDRGATHATRERHMRTRPPRAALRQPRHKPPDRAA